VCVRARVRSVAVRHRALRRAWARLERSVHDRAPHPRLQRTLATKAAAAANYTGNASCTASTPTSRSPATAVATPTKY
jgi:hypothetical protein